MFLIISDRSQSGEDVGQILCATDANRILPNTPRSLQHQLLQMQHEKMVLLDQLAQFEVPVCFSCQGKIPTLEATLGDMKERRLKRLHKLRETCVRASEKYKTERDYLLGLESKLNDTHKKSKELKSIIQNEQVYIESLNDEIRNIKNEQEFLAEVKLKSKQNLKVLKNDVKNLQNENFYYDVKEDSEYIQKECETMKHQLKEIRVERNELEMELFSIAKYITLKETELENLKKSLNGIRQEETLLLQAKDAAVKENNVLRMQLETSQNNILHLKNNINNHQDELRNSEDIIQQTKEAKEKVLLEQDKMRRELIDLGDGTKRLRNILNDYRMQRKNCEDQILHQEEELSALHTQLESIKSNVCESAQQVEILEKHYQDSQHLHETLRLQLVDEFASSRAQLRHLREQNDEVNNEIERLISPELQAKKEVIDKEKLNILQSDREIAMLRDTIKNKHQIITHLTNSLNILEVKHKELEQKCELETTKINQLKSVKDKNIQVVEDLEKSCEVLKTVCNHSALFTNHIQFIMQQFLNEFEQSSDKLKSVESSSTITLKTDENIQFKDFIELLQDYFVKYIDEHCNELKEKEEQYLEMEISQDTEKLKVLKEKRDTTKQRICVAEKEIKKLNKDLENLKDRAEEFKLTYEKTTSVVENSQKILRDSKEKNQDLEFTIKHEMKKLEHLSKERDRVLEEVVVAEAKLKQQETRLNDLRLQIKKFHEDELKKKSELKQIHSEIQQLELNITVQRKKRIDRCNLYSQERHEIIADTQTQNVDKLHGSLQDLAEKANEGLKNPYPLKNGTLHMQSPFNINSTYEAIQTQNSLSSPSSSDEDIEELMAIGKIRKK